MKKLDNTNKNKQMGLKPTRPKETNPTRTTDTSGENATCVHPPRDLNTSHLISSHIVAAADPLPEDTTDTY